MAKTSAPSRSTHMADTIANTFEWLITAFILAFVFRAFVMEAFRIPTGSMADTLKGAHFRMRCTQCGYRYDYGFVPSYYGFPEEYVPNTEQWLRPEPPRCSSCGYYTSGNLKLPIASGDRILVLKTLYQFRDPDRWDVVVFKNPEMPRINFIKRLIGKPGEKVTIIDGDIYINDKLARRPPHVQNEHWMPVYNNDYRPVKPDQPNFNGHTWREPFENVGTSAWNFASPTDPSVFTLDASKDTVSTAVYNTAVGNEIKATYAYNETMRFEFMPIVSDVRLSFKADMSDSPGVVGIALSKYQTLYKAIVDVNGLMSITASDANSKSVILASKKLTNLPKSKFVPVSFVNVDHMLTFTFGDTSISKDLGTDPNSAGKRTYDTQPYVAILGSGHLTLSHISLDRDTYYLDINMYSRERSRASEKKPFTLEKDEFFVCGDNSPNSHDSRWWFNEGIGNNKTYRTGVVPRDYLVGKAMFVYWPSGFTPFNNPRVPAVIPNFGALRFIYGGIPGYN